MVGWKKAIQAAAGLLLAAAAALAAGTWAFPGEKDLIASIGTFRLSVSGLGLGLSLLAGLGFADAWIGSRRRTLPEANPAGRLLNGLGFGFLPAAALWKIFEQGTRGGRGSAVPEELGKAGWLTENGAYAPARIEMGLALLLFAAVMLWLSLRKRELPENGDLAGVCLSLWSAGRMLTASFHEEGILFAPAAAGIVNAGLLGLMLILWTLRAFRQKKNTGYAIACVPVFLASAVILQLILRGIIRTGNPPADLVMEVCLALLALKAALCMGRVSR